MQPAWGKIPPAPPSPIRGSSLSTASPGNSTIAESWTSCTRLKRNARAAGRVTLRRGRESGEYAVREVGAAEAGPVLKRYVSIATRTRAFFEAGKDSPFEAFVAEANLHPVFELAPLDKHTVQSKAT